VVAMALLDALLVGALALQRDSGGTPEVFRSSHLEGAPEHNERLVHALRERVPHL